MQFSSWAIDIEGLMHLPAAEPACRGCDAQPFMFEHPEVKLDPVKFYPAQSGWSVGTYF